jgi:hypothetical protein
VRTEGVEPSWPKPPVSETGAYPCSATSAGWEPPACAWRAAPSVLLAQAAGRGRDCASRSCSRRALRRVSSWITLAGRDVLRFGVATRTTCRCIRLSSRWVMGVPRHPGRAPEVAWRCVPRARGDVALRNGRSCGRASPPGFEPGRARLELAVLPATPRACAKRTARIERASPEWRSGALPAELRSRDLPGWSRTSLRRRRTELVH